MDEQHQRLLLARGPLQRRVPRGDLVAPLVPRGVGGGPGDPRLVPPFVVGGGEGAYNDTEDDEDDGGDVSHAATAKTTWD